MSKLLSVSEVLEATGIARATLYRMIDEGLPCKCVGCRKKLFELEEVQEFIGRRKNALISMLEIGKEYSNEEICTIFKCSTQGGMRRSHSTGALVLASHHDDPTNAYVDYWKDDILYYTGMGMEGDQDFNFAQNKTLKESDTNGVVVYLFEVFSSRKYMYRGIVKLAKEPLMEQEHDFSGNLRWVCKFPLRLVNQNLLKENFVKKEHKYIYDSVRRLSNEDLKKIIDKVDGRVRSRITKAITYEYNMYVREYVKRRARGLCELCESNAPFMVNGQPFLKTYHLLPLSKGGEDHPNNVAALCPNCYERIIQLHSQDDINKVKNKIEIDESLFEI